MLNVAPAQPLQAEVLAALDWLVVNEGEACMLAGALGLPATDAATAADAWWTFFAQNRTPAVVRTKLAAWFGGAPQGAAQLAVRIVGSIGRIDQSHLRTGKLTDEEWPRLTEAIEKLRTISLHIDETAGLSTIGLAP